MKTFVVYMATNVSNGHRYIGYTSNGLNKRRVAHLGRARRREDGCEKFCHAIRKYGEYAFSWNVISVFTTHGEALAEEIRLIAELKPEYNLTSGGEGTTGIKSWNRKPVTCLNDGKMFFSGSEAGKFYGISTVSVSDVCRGKYRSVKGKYFVHGDVMYGQKERQSLISRIEAAHAIRRKQVSEPKAYGGIIDGKDATGRNASGPKINSKKVLCVSDGNVFPSASEAARHYKVCRSSLIELCNGKNGRTSVGGLKFKYHEYFDAAVT